MIAVNDNWQDTQKPEITDIGSAPADYRESAISTSLEPGAYTAVRSILRLRPDVVRVHAGHFK